MDSIEIHVERLQHNGFDLGESILEKRMLTDEAESQQFENATIYFHPNYGAFEVHGEILEKYIELGETESDLGFPISDQQEWFNSLPISYFENGAIARLNIDENIMVISTSDGSFSISNSAFLYEIDGTYIGTVSTFPDQSVVILDRDSLSFNQLCHREKLLPNVVFIELAAWAYNENTIDSDAQQATICVLNNMTKSVGVWFGFNKTTYDKQIDIALIDTIYKQSGYSDKTKMVNRNALINATEDERNNIAGMKSSISGVIKTLYQHNDITNGAIQEHGNDFFSNDRDANKQFKWAMRRDWQVNGFTWLENGSFLGKYTPETNSEHIGDNAKINKYDYKYIITASYGANVFCIFEDTFKIKKAVK